MEITKEMLVNEVIKNLPQSLKVFAEFNIDSCCGGAVSIEAAAARDGASLDRLLDELRKVAPGD